MFKPLFKLTLLAVVLLAVLSMPLATSVAGPGACTSIQDGGLTDSAGNLLVIGFDQFGYNYPAHEFNGTSDSSDRNLDGTYWGVTDDYVDDHLWMIWSDDWLSIRIAPGSKLDRGTAGISLGWLTNHVEGEYYDDDGNLVHYTDFVKIVWVGPGGQLWGQYEVILENLNDPTGHERKRLGAPGFGLNDHWTSN
jgi:hypothetical protein